MKRFRIKSELLSQWWGQPIWLGATVLLPRDYDKHPKNYYPVVYSHGHFDTSAPMNFDTAKSDFHDYWLADGTPRVILVTLQHPLALLR